MKKENKFLLIVAISAIVLFLIYYFSKRSGKNKKTESNFGKWKPDVVSPEAQLKSVMNLGWDSALYPTKINLSKSESNFRGGGGGGRGGRGGGGGRHHGGRGWGGYGYPYPYPIYYGGWGGYPYLDYPLLNEPVVIKADKCPEGFVYRGEKEGCKSIKEIAIQDAKK
jgi:hypothetical protein